MCECALAYPPSSERRAARAAAHTLVHAPAHQTGTRTYARTHVRTYLLRRPEESQGHWCPGRPVVYRGRTLVAVQNAARLVRQPRGRQPREHPARSHPPSLARSGPGPFRTARAWTYCPGWVLLSAGALIRRATTCGRHKTTGVVRPGWARSPDGSTQGSPLLGLLRPAQPRAAPGVRHRTRSLAHHARRSSRSAAIIQPP